MKKILFPLVYFLLLSSTLFAQEKEMPVIIHSIVGERIDKVENDYFKLFPAFDGFREAEFYLNPDSTLKAFVVYESSGVIKDTILQKHYTVEALRKHIDQKLAIEINTTQNIDRGQYVSTISSKDIVTTGELLSIRDSCFLLLNMEEEIYYDNSNSSFDVTHIQLADINKATAIDKTNIAKYIYPLVFGLTATLIYASTTKKENASTISEAVNKSAGNALIGAIIGGLGCLLGYALSSIIPIWNISETEYTAPFSEDDIEGLNGLARYQYGEPFYLQKIK